MKYLVLLILSSLSLFGQGFGESQPFLSSGTSGGLTNPVFLDLRNLTNVILYVDVNLQVTNQSGALAGNGDTVKIWGDLTTNHNDLRQLGGSSISPTNKITGGPTNGPCILFTGGVVGMNLTNNFAGTNLTQPVTMFFVVDFNNGLGYNNFNHNVAFVEGTTSSQWDAFTLGNNLGTPIANLFAGNNTTFNTPGGFGASWAVMTLQFNGVNSLIRVNGTNILSGVNAGANGAPGLTLGSVYDGSSPSAFLIAECLVMNASSMTNTANMLQAEESLGHEFGISVP